MNSSNDFNHSCFNVLYHLWRNSPPNVYDVIPFTVYDINIEQEEFTGTDDNAKQYTCNSSG